MARITAADLFEDVEVDLWGAQFRLRETTKKVSAQLAEMEKALEQADAEDGDAVVNALTGILDVLLEPVGSENGSKTHAKTILLRKWNANEIGVERIAAISSGIQEAAEQRSRPTSPGPSDG